MRARPFVLVLVAVVLLATVQPQAGAQTPMGTVFTYQGRLTDGGSPADGDFDFLFSLYDDLTGGGQVGSTVPANSVPVANGLFTVPLDFGNSFRGDAVWLEIEVRPHGSATYTLLSPRQELTPTPPRLSAQELTPTQATFLPHVANEFTPTHTPTATHTATHTPTATSTATATNTATATHTPTVEVTPTTPSPPIGPRVVHVQHGWWLPELPGEEPWLHGVWFSCSNVLTNDDPDQCDQIFGGCPLRAALCKVYKVKEY